MSQNRDERSPSNGNTSLPPQIVEQFLQTQRLSLENEAADLRLRERGMDLDAAQANKMLDMQNDFLKNQPNEQRKTYTRFAYIGGGLLLLCMIFIGFCLYLDKDEFLLKLLQIVGYFITTALGYYFGTKSGKKEDRSSEDGFTNAEIIQ